MPSSSFFLRSSITLLSTLSLISSTRASANFSHASVDSKASTQPYVLTQLYSGQNFFNEFNFYAAADPTHGYVTYVDQNTAQQNGLLGYDGTYNYWGVDTSTVLQQTSGYYGVNGIGRKSVRLEGTYTFTHGLVIADIAHMPSGLCGTWPAFWTLGGGTWPYTGEIDIIEGANQQSGNWMSLHTGYSSNIYGDSNPMSGSIQAYDCNVYTPNDNPNYTGCKIQDNDPASFGSYQGGVWAMQWTSAGITVWYWPYSSVPSDVTNGTPNPQGWGTPRSSFGPQSNLNPDGNFYQHHIIFDTTFCGDLGDATFASTGCGQYSGQTCAQFVAGNPSAFDNAYWQVKYVKIFQNDGTPAITSSTSSSTTAQKTSSTTAKTTTSSSKTSSTTAKTTTTPKTTTTSPKTSPTTSSKITTTTPKTTPSTIPSTTPSSTRPSTTMSTTVASNIRGSPPPVRSQAPTTTAAQAIRNKHIEPQQTTTTSTTTTSSTTASARGIRDDPPSLKARDEVHHHHERSQHQHQHLHRHLHEHAHRHAHGN